MKVPEIITEHVYPPIPCRDYDWCAYYAGYEEANQHGWGKTQSEAVEALFELEIEFGEE